MDLRVVHLVRDSRGVALSWTRLLRRPEVVDGEAMMATRPPVLLRVRWLIHNALFHLLGRVGVPTLLLRYGSLVRRPAAELTRVLTHAGRTPPTSRTHRRWLVQLGTSHAHAGNPMRFQKAASRSGWMRSGVTG